jgi:hypothetical protein
LDFLLTILGINTTRVLEVYENRIEYSYGSLSGYLTTIIPMGNISNMTMGFFKPVLWFIWALVFLIGGLVSSSEAGFGGIIVGLILAVGCIVVYYLRKTTYIGVIPNSAVGKGISFKRSIIENKNLSEEEAKQIIALINELISRSNGGGAAAAPQYDANAYAQYYAQYAQQATQQQYDANAYAQQYDANAYAQYDQAQAAAPVAEAAPVVPVVPVAPADNTNPPTFG